MAPPRSAKDAKSADSRTRRGSTAVSDAQPLSLEDLADKIDTFENNMMNRFSAVMDEVKGIKIRIDKVERCIDNHAEKLKRLDEEHTSMINAIDFFDRTIKEHRTNISRLERSIINPERMEFLEHVNRQKQVILSGIPFRTGENLMQALQTISTKIEAELDVRRDVDAVFRLKSSDRVMVRFQSSHSRDTFFTTYRKHPLKLADIGFSVNPEKKVFINEVLSEKVANIFYHARRQKKDKAYSHCWTINQKVYIRKTESSPAIHIKSLEDLQAL